MIFTQFYLDCLSHASYLVGDATTGRAVVVDPRRDVGIYLDEAAAHRLTIERVIETHVHADFLSGHLELAARTGAVISYGDAASVEFAIDPLHDGERLSLGAVTLEVLATPGHTPESICVLVYESADAGPPFAVLTGDTLLVGDVGRPDLSAAPDSAATDALARRLYHSLHDKLLGLPDSTPVYPAHGAGSACGKQLGTATSTTLGEQRRSNYALQPMSEDEFVAAVLEGQPAQPRYFSYDAQRNREHRPLLVDEAPEGFDLDTVVRHRAGGAALLDTREPDDFAAGHLRGAIHAALRGRFAETVGSVIAPDRDIVLVGEPSSAAEARARLGRVGYDRVVGRLEEEPARAHRSRPDAFETSSRLSVDEVGELIRTDRAVQVIDVRTPTETASGTIPGARTIPLAVLVDSMTAIAMPSPVVVYCATGNRSLTAMSLLRDRGWPDVSDLLGGYSAWVGGGRTVSS